MKAIVAAACSLLILSLTPAPLSAKFKTEKISITGPGLSQPLELTEPAVEAFNIYSGYGTFMNGNEGTKGFIIEWPKGIASERPNGLQHYEVTFHSKCLPPSAGEPGTCEPGTYLLIYKVFYDYDPASQQGFVYLPTWSDDAFQFNKRMWHGHGFEGNWSYASHEWETFVRPRIARAITSSAR